MTLRIAVFGAIGELGRELLAILDERAFPADDVVALSGRAGIGMEVSYGDRTLKTKDFEGFDFSAVELCMMATDAATARKWAPKIAAAGAIVIDLSTAFRMEPDVPLITPEVNAHRIDGWQARRIIACPSPAVSMLTTVLKPLHEAAGVERAVVTACLAVSDGGREAMDELWTQTKGIFVNQAVTPHIFPKQIAFNLIPHVDDFTNDGWTREEWRLKAETQKVLDPDVQVSATCLRAPVFVSHSLAVHIELAEPLLPEDARRLLRESPGVMVVDKREDEGYATPVEATGEWATYVSRIREDSSAQNGLALWIVADNLRTCAALNVVQIAELLLNRGVLKPDRPVVARQTAVPPPAGQEDWDDEDEDIDD